jgi:hypothetical protein
VQAERVEKFDLSTTTSIYRNMKRLVFLWCMFVSSALGTFLGISQATDFQAPRQQADTEAAALLINLVYQTVQNWSEGRTPLKQTIEVKRDGEYFSEPVYLATGKVTGEERFYLRLRARSHSPMELRIGDSTVFYGR